MTPTEARASSPLLTRGVVSRRLGLTYATLRVYERHLGDLLDLRDGPLKQGANPTVVYTVRSMNLVREAIVIKRRGLPYSLLRDYFLGLLVPGNLR